MAFRGVALCLEASFLCSGFFMASSSAVGEVTRKKFALVQYLYVYINTWGKSRSLQNEDPRLNLAPDSRVKIWIYYTTIKSIFKEKPEYSCYKINATRNQLIEFIWNLVYMVKGMLESQQILWEKKKVLWSDETKRFWYKTQLAQRCRLPWGHNPHSESWWWMMEASWWVLPLTSWLLYGHGRYFP